MVWSDQRSYDFDYDLLQFAWLRAGEILKFVWPDVIWCDLIGECEIMWLLIITCEQMLSFHGNKSIKRVK